MKIPGSAGAPREGCKAVIRNPEALTQPSSGLQPQQPPVVPGFRQTAAPPPMDWHQDTHSELLQQVGDEEQAGFTQAAAAAGRSTRAVATRARANRNIAIFFFMTLPSDQRTGIDCAW